jgi:RNA polymerase sigma-70 factor (ECF subfamily)
MKPGTTSGLIVIQMDNPALELENFDRLVEEYRRRVLRFLFANLRDMDLAETLTQECFLKAYQTRTSFRGDCSVHTWLMRIAIYLVRSHTRSGRFRFWRKAQQVENDVIHNCVDRSISPEERAVVNERIQAVWRAAEDLSEKQRLVFVLRYVEDMDILEIAQSTGLSKSAVNVHLFRAVRRIRKTLGTMK